MDDIVIYEEEGRAVEVRLDGESVWLTQRQMADILQTTCRNIGLHINKIYTDEELSRRPTMKESFLVQTEGERRISRKVNLYNLDVIISVAYRVNSKRGVRFRQWATGVLNAHLTRGYSLNRQRLERNAQQLSEALLSFQQAA